jgi:hypothetical protein
MDVINSLVRGKSFSMVIDLMMGSGNVLFNLDVTSDLFLGNDKQKLLPKIFEILKEEAPYTQDDVEDVITCWGRFSKKENYYQFRDHWNKKYLSENFNRVFIIETILLLKMCSNSMVRFNPKEGYFNQGFRGLGDKSEFFRDDMKKIVVENVNELISHLRTRNYRFTHDLITEYKDAPNKRLIIIDPPYILRPDMYDNDFTKETDKWILSLLKNTENKFIYFNYLQRGDQKNLSLLEFLDSYPCTLTMLEINKKTMAGQQRSKNIIDVEEVVVTNV